MSDKINIDKEIFKTKTEIAMAHANDGWWNQYMIQKLKRLKEMLKREKKS